MDVYKDSNGDFWCKVCNTKYISFDKAKECADKHAPKDNSALVVKNNCEKDMAEYKQHMADNNTIESSKKLVISLLEDYHASKENDMQSRAAVGPLTLKLGEAATNALMQLNKQIYGEKSSSVNINVDSKKSEMEALRDMLVSKQKKRTIIDGEVIDKN